MKIHGDASTPEGRVLTRGQYDAQYGSGRKRSELAKLLLHLFAARPVLFLGCRVEQDRYLRLIRRAGAPPGGWHFAVLPRQGGAKWLRDRTEYLKTLRIRPLWYDDGHFDAVPEFLRELTGRRRTPRGKRRAREVDRFIRTADELERRLAACTSADEKIEVFFARVERQVIQQFGRPASLCQFGTQSQDGVQTSQRRLPRRDGTRVRRSGSTGG